MLDYIDCSNCYSLILWCPDNTVLEKLDRVTLGGEIMALIGGSGTGRGTDGSPITNVFTDVMAFSITTPIRLSATSVRVTRVLSRNISKPDA